MGHHLDSKSSIVPLIDRLNKFPVGLVDNEKLREILSLLFDEREAFIASRFPLEEATLPELVRLTGIPAAELEPMLDRMADKGLLMDMPYNGVTYYLLIPGLIGFFEFTFMKNRTDLPQEKIARLMSEYMHDGSGRGQGDEFFGSKTPLTRSLVYEEHIPVTSEITTYETAREIIKNAGGGAVGICFCRHKKEHLNENCKKGAPVEEICISLGAAAKFFCRRGFAQEKSVEELLAILDRARSFNLTFVTDNIREKPSFVCSCCGCCCELMSGVQHGFHEGIGKTGYTAVIDPELCDYCGACFKACNVKAIGPPEGVTFADKESRHAAVKSHVCLGCGACVSACKKGALTMVSVAKRPLPPLKRNDLYRAILKEKGRLTPYVVSGIKKKLRSFLPGNGRKR
ncbi:MAG TPA: 4Fe-4S ferredoxin [Geobacter sp.]|nr:4Fe-4S ferredoxin [Geobacter sp.]